MPRIESRAVASLAPDHQNPRIPENQRAVSEDDLLIFIAENYDSATIAKSITEHEFFISEPLIAVEEEGRMVVVEGNRRLAALRLLNDANLRGRLANADEWNAFLEEATIPTEVPVVIADDRRSVAPIIGYRHISGIEPWDAYAKARYIAMQIEDTGLSFQDTASEVGERENEVRASYRNYKIALQAEALGINVDELRNNFGVFTRAMSSEIKNFVGAPAPRDVALNADPIPTDKTDELRELVGFLFGPNKVLTDSRDLGKLSKVLNSTEGVEVLRITRNLDEADVASGGLLARLINRLSAALNNLTAAQLDIAAYREEADVVRLVGECETALEALK